MARRKLVPAVATVAVIAVSGVGATTALGGGDSDATVTGSAAAAATAAALRATGGGTANSVERDSGNGAVWEVEVTGPDGRTVDVRLAADLSVVVVEGDVETGDGSD